MSAFICDPFHISSLVHAALMYNRRYATVRFNDVPVSDATATSVGYALLAANIKSVQTRYPDDTYDNLPGPIPTPVPDDYQYRHSSYYPTQAVTILKAISCFEYQSCEYDDFDESPIAAFCESLRRAAINALPGYDDAPWELTKPDIDAIRARIAKQVS